MPGDLGIAQAATLKPIIDSAREVGMDEDNLDFYGKYKAKVHLDEDGKVVGLF